MQSMSCPSCGGPVDFRSHASVIAVCDYCHTTVLKEASAIRNLGKTSEVLEDYSPIQLGTTGHFEGHEFTVVGRIQIRYAAGFWNEWYAVLNDGTESWIGEANGQFTFTQAQPTPVPLPPFESFHPGTPLTFQNKRYIASDVRRAQTHSLQGELPFAIRQGWVVKAVDLRQEKHFLTLDYSDESPRVYTGRSVKLAELKCQLLRDDEHIKQATGHYRGKVDILDCPQCGSPISFVPGLTPRLSCPACASQLSASGETTEVLEAANRRLETHVFSIALGTHARINNAAYTLIGALRRQSDEGERWSEYLFYGPHAGFLWLVETETGWYKSQLLDNWPENAATEDHLIWNGAKFALKWDYQAEVTLAVGAFNWEVKVGDATHIQEYQSGRLGISRETDAHEMTLSRSEPIAAEELKRALTDPNAKPDSLAQTPFPVLEAQSNPRHIIMKSALIFLGIVNAIPIIFGGGRVIITVLVAALLIWGGHVLTNTES